MIQQRCISGACCLLLMALGATAISPTARTTGALDVKLTFEGMQQQTFEQKYEQGSRMAIAKAGGIPGEYVSYEGRYSNDSSNPNEAVAHFSVLTTTEPWGQKHTVRRKLLASAAANGHVFYSFMARFGAPFKPAVSVDGVDILYGSQAGDWDTPKSRFVNTSSPAPTTPGMYLDATNLTLIGGNSSAIDPDSGALVASTASNSSRTTNITDAAAAAGAAAGAAENIAAEAAGGAQMGQDTAAAAAAPSDSSGTSPMRTSLPLKVFIPVVVLGAILAILAMSAAGIALWRLSKAARNQASDEESCEGNAPGAPVEGSGVVLYDPQLDCRPEVDSSLQGYKSHSQAFQASYNHDQADGKQSSRYWR